MSKFVKGLICICAVMFSVNVFATSTTTVVERKVIVTPVPAPKQVIEAPQGYVNCVTVEAAWVGDSWIPEHQMCTYKNVSQGTTWVGSYWSCTKYTDGNCTNWEWVPGHWEQITTAS